MQVIKLVLLTIVGFGLLMYLTVEPPVKIEKKLIILKDLPKTIELLGYENKTFATNSIIKKDSIIFVGNHESIVLATKLNNMINLKKWNYVIVSNISDAPWFIKKWQAHTKNIQLKGKNNLPWIYDKDGAIRNFLQVPTSDALKYFIYKVNSDNTIDRIYTGKVKKGTIDGKMNEDEIKENLKNVIKLL